MNDLETVPIANNDGNGRRKEGPGREGAHVDSMGSFCGPATGSWVVELGRGASNAEHDTNACWRMLEAKPREGSRC